MAQWEDSICEVANCLFLSAVKWPSSFLTLLLLLYALQSFTDRQRSPENEVMKASCAKPSVDQCKTATSNLTGVAGTKHTQGTSIPRN